MLVQNGTVTYVGRRNDWGRGRPWSQYYQATISASKVIQEGNWTISDGQDWPISISMVFITPGNILLNLVHWSLAFNTMTLFTEIR